MCLTDDFDMTVCIIFDRAHRDIFFVSIEYWIIIGSVHIPSNIFASNKTNTLMDTTYAHSKSFHPQAIAKYHTPNGAGASLKWWYIPNSLGRFSKTYNRNIYNLDTFSLRAN